MSGRFSIVKKGYNTEEVDDYLDSVRDYLSKLEEKQKNALKEVKDLKSTLQDLKQKEASLNNALVNSQISADGILMSARNAADNIVKNARNEAEMSHENVCRHLTEVFAGLAPYRRQMLSFREDFLGFVSGHLKEMDDAGYTAIAARFDALEKYLGELTADESDD